MSEKTVSVDKLTLAEYTILNDALSIRGAQISRSINATNEDALKAVHQARLDANNAISAKLRNLELPL